MGDCQFLFSHFAGVGQEYGTQRCEANDRSHLSCGEGSTTAVGHGQRIDEHQRHNRSVPGEFGHI
jgi:hypothetical protein